MIRLDGAQVDLNALKAFVNGGPPVGTTKAKS